MTDPDRHHLLHGPWTGPHYHAPTKPRPSRFWLYYLIGYTVIVGLLVLVFVR